MPSQLHEVLVMLFRNRPDLAPTLLRDALHVELPEYTGVRLESAELTDVVPTEYRADLVILLVFGQPIFGIVIEAQLQPDERKRMSWPVYAVSLRARLECPCCLLVITPSDKTAAWAAEPIELGAGNFYQPLVLGPSGVPVVTELEKARHNPELALLSVMAHGRGDVETAVKIATSAASATSAFDEDTRALYTDLIETALSEAARKVFGMLPQNYQFQGPSFKKGQAVGEVIGEVKAVLTVLEARGLQPSAEQRERILTTTDPVQVHHLVRKAVTAQSVDELFE